MLIICRYLCFVSCLYATVLGPWSGWQAACNSLNEEKYEVSLLAIVSLSGPWSGWQAACNSLNDEKYEVSLLVTVSQTLK
jgi:hypothetical protein